MSRKGSVLVNQDESLSCLTSKFVFLSDRTTRYMFFCSSQTHLPTSYKGCAHFLKVVPSQKQFLTNCVRLPCNLCTDFRPSLTHRTRIRLLNDMKGIHDCLEALLHIMDSFGFSLIFPDVGIFQDRKLVALLRDMEACGGPQDRSRTPLTTFARCWLAGSFQESMI